MLPILLKLQFDSVASLLVYLILAFALVAYSAWAGAKNATSPNLRLWRALPFAFGAALALSAATVWVFPPMNSTMITSVKVMVIGFGTALALFAAFYGAKAASKPENALSEGIKYGVMGIAIAFVAAKFSLSGQMGRHLGLPLHTYGLMIATAFLVAIGLASRIARRTFPENIVVEGKTIPAGPYMAERTLDIGFWMLISGILGAKLLFVIVNRDKYAQAPLDALSLSGGLVFYGGFIGAALCLIFYCRHYRLDFLRIADAFAPALAIGHMIGRIGCLAAGCCWGGFAKAGSLIAIQFPSAANLPFNGFGTGSLAFSDQLKDDRWVDALGQVHQHAVVGAQQISAYARANGYTLPVYPTQLMEIVGELLIFCLLMFFMNKKRFNGQILATWLIGYAILRTNNEFFRGDVARGYIFKFPAEDPVILSTSQGIALGLFLTGLAIMVVQGLKTKSLRNSFPKKSDGNSPLSAA